MLQRFAHRRPRPIAENKIFAAAIATVAVGATQGVLDSFNVFGSKAVTELLAFLACVWLFPNEPGRRWNFWLLPVLVGAGLICGALWIAFAELPPGHASNPIPLNEVPFKFYLLGIVTSCVVAPLFEEKVVRHLFLDGASHYFGKVAGAIIVSALFAAVHVDAVVSSFIYSVILCIGAIVFGLNTFQRSIIHGVINLSIMHWALLHPLL
ncbi:CPBP family intramembrane metalloprotease [Stenotrophomonas maltophilia]|uniref:CPBP family intramembrane glutamic endopeptidase n=1 Tax=Stenotrophomonas maltophilia TaxID=40324 RepID=UPI0010A9D3F7|nr:CPBP family intramembrane glutamic endopeptidase [Stenotrophomonas maltophilia]TIE18297.1 CPBP family intramembrane metalloprotease [Stenotrophomonas maltophilia]TIE59189.1 CPBP family intramembrane metalloprotease [Stenotrophomonas maltophilia]